MLGDAAPGSRANADGSRFAARLAWTLVALALALAVAGLIVSLPAEDDVGHSVLYDLSWWVIAVTWGIVGALIASRQPRNPIGWILCGLTLYAGFTSLPEGYLDRYLAGKGGSLRWAEIAAWFSNTAWIPLVFVPLAFLPVYFPHGRLPSRRWRFVPWCAAIGIAAFWVSEAFAAGPLHDYPGIGNPFGLDHVVVEALGFGSLLVFGAVAASVASVVVRFRRTTDVERQQIKWLAYAGCLAAAMLVAAGFVGGLWSEDLANTLILAGLLGITVAIGIAILRYRLYDIDLLINRTLVYAGLTVGVVAIYIALVGGLAAVVHEQAGWWLALVATGLAALLVQPLRSGLQRRVNRLMYGPGEDARGASGLRGRLHEAFAPEAAELQRARERLVAAREEERRRLRRDLHDGLGPALAGAALKVEAAENLLGSKPGAAAALLGDARAEIQDAVADVRRLVYDLRPPALDELGLAGALREQAGRLSAASELRIDVHASPSLNGLPAAVEVAAYRIVLEAMTNAARHARARRCVVRIEVDGALELEIGDDGQGLPSGYRAGVGLASMRERAEELGGICEIEPGGAPGTRVRARLPLAPS
jgi:signal transduction histidine kinase